MGMEIEITACIRNSSAGRETPAYLVLSSLGQGGHHADCELLRTSRVTQCSAERREMQWYLMLMMLRRCPVSHRSSTIFLVSDAAYRRPPPRSLSVESAAIIDGQVLRLLPSSCEIASEHRMRRLLEVEKRIFHNPSSTMSLKRGGL